MSGELIGDRYLLRRPVGRGGMGTVWLGTDQTLHRDVAVKQMRALPGETSAGTARAMREARSAAAISHRNAVSAYDVVTHEGAPWLVMEHFPSRTLSEIIREDGPMSPERAGRIGAQIAEALTEAHKLGIMHRDVKPGNILVGDGDLAKISDFGIARAELDATLTQTGMMTGTPAYFAPELATGDSPSPASDVWGLGATVYAAVEGNPPYGTDGNPLQLLSRIVYEPVPRPVHAGPLLPVLSEMLAKDPRQRPTMAEVAAALTDLPDRTLMAPTLPPPAVIPPIRTNDQRSRRRVVPAALAGLLLVLVLAAGGWALLNGGEGGSEDTDDAGQREPAGQADNRPSDDGQSPETPDKSDENTPPAAGDPVEFVEDYYALMPDDTDSGWSMLGGSLKSQSRSDYEAFWNTIDSVEVSNVTAVSETSVVYDITYVGSNGTSPEHKQITLERYGDSFRIVEDVGI